MNGTKTQKKSGIAYLVAAAALCSIGGVCIKFIPWTPLAINGTRCAIAACISAFAMIKRRHKPCCNAAVLRGALCLALTTILYVFATKLTSAAAAILEMYTAPLWVLLYLWIFKHKKPGSAAVVSCIGVVAGTALFVADGLAAGGGAAVSAGLGNLLGLASGLTYAGVFLVNETPEGDAPSSYCLGQLIAACVGVPFLWRESDFSPIPLACVALLGVFQLGLSYLCMARGVARTSPGTASVVTCLEPLLCPVWVWLLYGEALSPTALAGAGVVLCSMLWHQTHTGEL